MTWCCLIQIQQLIPQASIKTVLVRMHDSCRKSLLRITSALPSALTQDQSLYGTDIALALLPENRNAVIYLQPNHTIGLDVRGSAFATALNQSPSSNQSTWPAQIPFNRISATALATDPSIVLVYYQTSNTTLAEISFNFTSGMWGPSPVNIEIP